MEEPDDNHPEDDGEDDDNNGFTCTPEESPLEQLLFETFWEINKKKTMHM